MRSRRNVKAFGLVDKLGKKSWRNKDSEDDDEVKKDTSDKRSASLDDPEERREWRKKIREVIDNHNDVGGGRCKTFFLADYCQRGKS